MRNQPRILFLIGPRGSGKTTIGRLVAERLGLPQVTSIRTLDIDGTTLRAERVHDGGYSEIMF